MSLQLEAQNIVMNAGFEDIFICPNSPGQVWSAEPWSSSGGSPDLYNYCGELGYDIPINKVGFQDSRTGDGYAHFATFFENSEDAREFLQGELKYPLVSNQQYYFQAYVSQCDSLQFATHNIGITFTNTDPLTHLECYPFCEIYVENDASNPLTSKTYWVLIEGTFVANGGEQFIHIGNLRPDSTSEIEFVGGGLNPDITWNEGGYYIDDVWLSHVDSAHYVSVNEELEIRNYELQVYPNPSAAGSVTVKCDLQGGDVAELRVFDMSSRQVYRNSKVCGANAVRLEGLSEGLYHCVLVINGKASLSEKIVILRE